MKRGDRISIAGARPGISRLRVRKKLQPVDMRTEARPPLIVSGMHRSGTSFVASLLRAAGLDMGARLMPAASGNARGHFENLDFVEFHMRWLRLTGHDASGWAAAQGLALPDDAVPEAREVLESNARGTAWGWKDPRTTLFLDFWDGIAPKANYLFVYREPSEVIDSLFRRGDEVIRLSPEIASQAYQRHNNMILRFARARRSRCLIVNVSEVARNPKRFLELISQRFQLDVDVHAPSPFDAEQMKKIAPDSPRSTLLRHLLPELERLYVRLEREADLPAAKTKGRPATAKRAREALLSEWCGDDMRQSALAVRDAELRERNEQLGQVRAFLADAEAGIQKRDAELSTRQTRIEELLAQLTQTQAVLSARDTDLGVHQEQLQQARAFLADAEAGIQNRDRELSVRQARIEELLAQLTQTQSALSARDTDLGVRQEQLHQAREFLAGAEDGIQKRDAELTARQARIEELLAQLTQTQAALSARDTELGAHQEQLQQARAFLSEAETGIKNRDGELAKRDAELRARQEQLEQMRTSLSEAETGIKNRDGELAKRDAELRARQEQLEQMRTSLSEAEAGIKNRDGELAKRDAELRARQEQLEQERTLLSEARAEIQKRDAELAASRARMEELLSEIARQKAQLESTRSILIRQTNDLINETRAESETLALLINTIQSGRFWKLKRGLARIFGSLHPTKAGVRQ